MEQIIPHRSVRFFPHWNTYDPDQVIGFINIIQTILTKKKSIDRWLELGSLIGESANLVLAHSAIRNLVCVDASSYLVDFLKKRHRKYIYNGRCTVHNQKSQHFLKNIPHNYMDVVYIDADHGYEAVKVDIELSFDKLQTPGFLSGHDYNLEHQAFPGSIKAIDEFSQKHGLYISRFIDNSWLMVKE